MTKDLYTPKDVSEVREEIYKEQGNVCKLSKIAFDLKDMHTDHKHDDEQLVRGILYKQSNLALGKVEGLYNRYLSYWYPGTLSDFLRQAADYIELPQDTRYRHPGWIKKIQTRFNKLSATQMKAVLEHFAVPTGKNLIERKKIFGKLVLDRDIGYNRLREVISTIEQNT